MSFGVKTITIVMYKLYFNLFYSTLLYYILSCRVQLLQTHYGVGRRQKETEGDRRRQKETEGDTGCQRHLAPTETPKWRRSWQPDGIWWFTRLSLRSLVYYTVICDPPAPSCASLAKYCTDNPLGGSLVCFTQLFCTPNLQNTTNPKPLKLGTWIFYTMFTTCHVSCVACHLSPVTCHV